MPLKNDAGGKSHVSYGHIGVAGRIATPDAMDYLRTTGHPQHRREGFSQTRRSTGFGVRYGLLPFDFAVREPRVTCAVCISVPQGFQNLLSILTSPAREAALEHFGFEAKNCLSRLCSEHNAAAIIALITAAMKDGA
jgi:hypothetical protein